MTINERARGEHTRERADEGTSGRGDAGRVDKEIRDEGTSGQRADMTRDKRTTGQGTEERGDEDKNIHLIDGKICYFGVVQTNY